MTKDSGEPLPIFIDPMLAQLGSLPLPGQDEDWVFERKWDGVRSIVRWDGKNVTLTSRNDADMTIAYPELGALGDVLGRHRVLLDGEIVSFDADHRPSFGRLQKRMHVGNAAAAQRLAESEPIVIMVFDVLHLDGEPLTGRPFTERRAALESLGLDGEHWQTPTPLSGTAVQAFGESKTEQLEGVVAKRRSSPYRIGRRSPDWTKLKNIRTQEVVVGGWRPGAGAREGEIGSLLLGLPADDGLHYIGRVGTGFTQALLTDLKEQLKPARSSPFVDVPKADARDASWVQPDFVGEVAFAEWTSDNRLRQPAWRGLRPDKRPDQVVKES
jgi:bifunctional non-homologous end joining protein LigD